MKKSLRIAPWVVRDDLQAIYDYHRLFSAAKAERILLEYDRVIGLIDLNPLMFHPRENGWRVYPFDSGTYLLYFKELPDFWLVAGIFHALREPRWIEDQLNERTEARPGEDH